MILLIQVAFNQQEGSLTLQLALVLHDLELVGFAHDFVLKEDISEDVLEHLRLGNLKEHFFIVRAQGCN